MEQSFEKKTNMILANFAYTDYFSNWVDMSCAAWGVLCAQNLFFRNIFKVETWLFHALNVIVPSFATFNCWAYFASHPLTTSMLVTKFKNFDNIQ